MTTSKNLTRYGAFAAATAFVAGAMAFGSSRLQERVSSQPTQELIPLRKSREATGDSKSIIDWLSTTTMPILDNAVAARNKGARQFELKRPSLLLSAIQKGVAQADHCHPYWRPLVTGPSGREVANICPGNAVFPPPTTTLHFPLKLQLPSLAYFNRAFDHGNLDLRYTPKPSDADQAGATTLKLLQSREQNRLTQSEGHLPVPLPFSNQLDWAPSPAANQSYHIPNRSISG